MKYKNEAGEISCDCHLYLSMLALDIYKDLNTEIFKVFYYYHDVFYPSLVEIYKAHKQEFIDYKTYLFYKSYFNPSVYKIKQNKKVLLAFSGGLDSMYQAFNLRELGYEVILFHCKNMNYYTNGKEYQVCEEFAKTFNFPIVYSTFKQNTKDNPYKKYWKENSFKNILLYSIMIDYCCENAISNISCGDDLRLDVENAIVGTNIADAYQVTLPFAERVKYYFNINFLFLPSEVNKAERLKKLKDNNALDIFYSCVNPGRFNQLNHNKTQNKFNVSLEKYNCGVCRKCAFHSLLRHYFLQEEYNKEFIDYCWKKISIGADNVFFNLNLPLEKRIENLIEY